MDLTVPSKRGGSYTNLVLANDISIEKAVQSVSDTLYVYLREDPALPPSFPSPLSSASPTAPELRVYLSELYGQLWDVCYLHRNLQLDVRIIYNTTAGIEDTTSSTKQKKSVPTAGKKGGGSNTKGKKEEGGKGGAEQAVVKPTGSQGNLPTTREDALLKPELEVVFSRQDAATELTNAKREALGLRPVALEWLDDAVRVALETSFYYLEDEQSHIPHFPRVAVGGTFDRLHNGHKKLLTLAASVCQSCLTIGITSSEMLAKKKNANQIESLEDRIETVRSFLHSVFPNLLLDIVVLKDPYGPPAHEKNFDAIVVSSETIAGAAKINAMRIEKGFPPLVVVVTRRTVSSLLSSTFIRNNLPPRSTR